MSDSYISVLPFFLPYSVPVLAVLSFYSTNPWHSLIPSFFVWFFIPSIDMICLIFTSSSKRKLTLTKEQRLMLDARLSFRMAIYFWVPTQVSFLLWSICQITQSQRWDLGPNFIRNTCLLSSVILCGAEGINCSHELFHRRSCFERFMGDVLLSFVCYGHFAVEHTRGHHLRVATPQDPATFRVDQSFYSFLPRTIFGGFKSALSLEINRLRKYFPKSSQIALIMTLENQVFRSIVIQSLISVLILIFFGTFGLFLFFLQSLSAVILLEQVNAIEHYGLLRKRRCDGTYEPVGPRHSWDAPLTVSNYIMFKLQLHADHHLRKLYTVSQCLYITRTVTFRFWHLFFRSWIKTTIYNVEYFRTDVCHRYQSLTVTEKSPKLPAGYLSLAPLLWFPPLWRRTMDPILKQYQEQWRIEDSKSKINWNVST